MSRESVASSGHGTPESGLIQSGSQFSTGRAQLQATT